MHPDLYLLTERVRASELQAEARRHRPAARPAVWRRRLGWAMVETGLRLLAHAPSERPA